MVFDRLSHVQLKKKHIKIQKPTDLMFSNMHQNYISMYDISTYELTKEIK